jgi:hypothetical protein
MPILQRLQSQFAWNIPRIAVPEARAIEERFMSGFSSRFGVLIIALSAVTASAQQQSVNRETPVPRQATPARDAAALSEEELRMNSTVVEAPKTARPLLRAEPNAITPAEDISAGTFGTNSGGGTYVFPGNLGLGTTSPGGKLHMVNGAFFYETIQAGDAVFGFNFRKSRGSVGAQTIVANGDSTGFFQFQGFDGSTYRQTAIIRGLVEGTPASGAVPGNLIFGTTPTGSSTASERLRITAAGNVGIGTTSPTQRLHVVGNATFTGSVTGGSISATYQDIAEWVPAAAELEPGTVVVLNPDKMNEVMKSVSAYDTRVAGVVSEQPGLTLGIPGDAKEMIATTGRVRVRVDASAAPILVGDLLVTSDKPGTAMRSVPMTVNGRPFHQPGTIIGKALEPLKDGEGTILVLLSLQ